MLKIILLIFATLVAKCSSAKKSSSSSSASDGGAERLQAIAAKTNQYPALPLTDGNFSKFITLRPREYYATIMFTAMNPKYQCGVCQRALMTYAETASYYNEQYELLEVPLDKRMAFFVVDVDSGRGTFDDMKLETVPRFYVLPPRNTSSPKLKMGDFEVPSMIAMEGTAKFLDEIERLSGIKVVVTVDSKPLLVGLSVVAALVALVISYAATDLQNAWTWYQNKYIWAVVSTICFAVGVSGSISCIIRSAPLYGMGRQGVAQIFAGAGREQYVIEGLIVAGWSVGCGVAGLLMYYSTKAPLWIVRHVLVILSMAIFVVLGQQIFEAYVEKTRWYQVKETVPPHVWEFLTASVKKKSGLFKRLLRVSEIWLNEYKDWPSFQNKFKLLVVDYTYRLFTGAAAVASSTASK